MPNLTGVPHSPELRQEALKRRALDLLCGEPYGPLMAPIIDELRDKFGVDIRNNPDHVHGIALLQDAFRSGESPSSRAWQLLGVA